MLQIIALLLCFQSFIQVLVSSASPGLKTFGFILTALAVWWVLKSWDAFAVVSRNY